MIVAKGPNGARAVTYVDADDVRIPVARPGREHGNNDPIDRIIEMRAVGVTPEYLAAIRAASPALRGADLDDVVSMRAVGVTPDFIRGMVASGLANLDADELTQARAVGLTPDYVRQMAAAGFRGDLDDYVEMRAVGVTPAYAEQFRKAGYPVLSAKQLIKLKTHGITAEAFRGMPRSSQPPRGPTVNPGDDDGG